MTATSSISYHTIEGFVTIIPRPTVSLGSVVAGKVLNLLTNFGTAKPKWFCGDIWIDKLVGDIDFYIVRLGCGTLLKFDASDLYEDDGRRWIVDVKDATPIDELPEKVKVDISHLKPFEF